MQTVLDERRRRAAYRATHRGTKEMDWLLGRYAQARLAAMSDADLEQFERLIEQADPVLQELLMTGSGQGSGQGSGEGSGQGTGEDAAWVESEFAELIGRIRAHHGIDGTAS